MPVTVTNINKLNKLSVITKVHNDWDTCIIPGTYSGTDATNAPSPTGVYVGDVYRLSNFVALQIVQTIESSNVKTYRRFSEEVSGILTFVNEWEEVSFGINSLKARKVLDYNNEYQEGFVYGEDTAANSPILGEVSWGYITKLLVSDTLTKVSQVVETIFSTDIKIFRRTWNSVSGWSTWQEQGGSGNTLTAGEGITITTDSLTHTSTISTSGSQYLPMTMLCYDERVMSFKDEPVVRNIEFLGTHMVMKVII